MAWDGDWNVFKANTLRLLVSDVGGPAKIQSSRDSMASFLNIWAKNGLDKAVDHANKHLLSTSTPNKSTPRKRARPEPDEDSAPGRQTKKSDEPDSEQRPSKRKIIPTERALIAKAEATKPKASTSRNRASASPRKSTGSPKKPTSKRKPLSKASNANATDSPTSSPSRRPKTALFEGVFVPRISRKHEDDDPNKDAEGDDDEEFLNNSKDAAKEHAELIEQAVSNNSDKENQDENAGADADADQPADHESEQFILSLRSSSSTPIPPNTNEVD